MNALKEKKAPATTKIVSQGRKKEYTVTIKEPKEVTPFKSKWELLNNDFSIFNPSDFKITKRSGKRTLMKGTKSNKKQKSKYSSKNIYESYKGDIRDLAPAVFNRFFMDIVTGVMNNEYMFKLPMDMGMIRATPVDKASFYKPIMKSMRVKAEDVKYKLHSVKILYTPKADITHTFMSCTLIPYGSLYNKVRNRLLHGHNAYSTNKIKTFREAMEDISKVYYDIPKIILRKIIVYGFKKLKKIHQIGGSISFQKFRGFGKDGVKLFDRITTSNYRNKNPNTKNERKFLSNFARNVTNKLYKIRPRMLSGWMYTSLSEYENYHILTHQIHKRLTTSMEEAMLNPYKYPYIVAVYVGQNHNKTMTKITRAITYERGNFKYLWKWDDSRFRTFDNSKQRIDRLHKRNDNIV